MPRRLLVALWLSLLIPIGVAGWLGLRLADEEQGRVEARFAELLRQRLADYAEEIRQLLEQQRRSWGERLASLALAKDPSTALRRSGLPHPFLLGPDGVLRHPDPQGAGSAQERGFLQRTAEVWRDGVLLDRALPPEEGAPAAPQGSDSGWYAWYWGNGLNLLFWQRLPDGGVVGSEIDQLGGLAEIIARLPNDGGTPDRLRLRDGRGRILYQWGGYEPTADEPARAALPLAEPLDGWHLEYLTPAPPGGAGARLQRLSGLGALGLAILAIGLYSYRELTRAMREAKERVSFVNQVSHELKTPLTNIRLYAELLEEELEADDPARQRLGVIVAETQRLSRLIGNVLSLARGQRGALRLHLQTAVVDDSVREVVEQFRPALIEKGIHIELDLQAPGALSLDPDALAQILGNLIGNVEKYAAAGGMLAIATRQLAGHIELRVRDCGPGIPKAHRDRLFRLFYRIRNDLTEGVSGTGIGLAIARDLARLHGGDLALEEGPGATFLLKISRRLGDQASLGPQGSGRF